MSSSSIPGPIRSGRAARGRAMRVPYPAIRPPSVPRLGPGIVSRSTPVIRSHVVSIAAPSIQIPAVVRFCSILFIYV